MNFEQPKPDSKKYSDLITEIQKGIIKIPKFQRDFVWSIDNELWDRPLYPTNNYDIDRNL